VKRTVKKISQQKKLLMKTQR